MFGTVSGQVFAADASGANLTRAPASAAPTPAASAPLRKVPRLEWSRSLWSIEKPPRGLSASADPGMGSAQPTGRASGASPDTPAALWHLKDGTGRFRREGLRVKPRPCSKETDARARSWSASHALPAVQVTNKGTGRDARSPRLLAS